MSPAAVPFMLWRSGAVLAAPLPDDCLFARFFCAAFDLRCAAMYC